MNKWPEAVTNFFKQMWLKFQIEIVTVNRKNQYQSEDVIIIDSTLYHICIKIVRDTVTVR